MAQITTTIPFVDMPVAADGEAAFITKANALPPQFTALTNDSQSFATQANALRDEVNGFQQTATAQAVAAANSATLSEQWATTTGALVNGIDYSAQEYAIGTTVESAKRHASGTVATGSAKDWASSTIEVADGLKGSRGYAQDSQTALSDVQSVIALAETVPFTLTSGDDFDSLSKVWPLIRTAFETNSLPWKPIVNLDFARDNYEAYVGLSAGTTRAPLLDLATFSRASDGKGTNAFGNIETVSANQPRIVFENGVAKGILLEDTATNLLTWSEDFSNGSWTKSNATISSYITESPSGGVLADKLIESSTSSNHSVRNTTGLATGAAFVTLSVYAKASERSQISLEIFEDVPLGKAVFDLTSGAVVSGSDSKIDPISNGWFRCSITKQVVTGASVLCFAYTANSGVTNYQGDGVSGIYIWGAQLEQSSAPSSYIKTEGTSVVRAADDFSYALPSELDWGGDWTLFIDISEVPQKTESTVLCGLTIDAPSFNSSLYITKNQSNNITIASGSNVNCNINLGIKPEDSVKIALRYSSGVVSACINGGALLSDSSVTMLGFTKLTIARAPWIFGNYANSKTRKIKIIQAALPDVVCQAITGV